MYVRQWDVAALARLLKVVNSDGRGILKKGLPELHLPHSQQEGVGPARSVFRSRPERDD